VPSERTGSGLDAAAQPRERRFPCRQCGAFLTFQPNTQMMVCAFCGHRNRIEEVEKPDALRELDFHAWLGRLAEQRDVEESHTVKCDACAAEFGFEGDTFSGSCPFCGSATVTDAGINRHIRPSGLLPFGIDRSAAEASFDRWLSSRWFAPSDLKRRTERRERLSGTYLPYWTYDSATRSVYRGQRGDRYTTVEWANVTDAKGNVRRVQQPVTRIRWRPAAGQVARDFDDVLVPAADSLPGPMLERLEPWDLQDIRLYRPEYLAGFRALAYGLDLSAGFDRAKVKMDTIIRQDVGRAIGGDVQRIDHVQTRHDDVTFKHVLLPVWLAAYRYRGRPYRFMVNARTGQVQGERPWSWPKIAAAAVLAALLLAIVFALLADGGLIDQVLR
jgi:Zn finger protein HypA/HybF involved in hydrogenase expression